MTPPPLPSDTDERIDVIEGLSGVPGGAVETAGFSGSARTTGPCSRHQSESTPGNARLRAECILLGDVRGDEVLGLLQALNTGYSCKMSAVIANSDSRGGCRTCVPVSGARPPQSHASEHRRRAERTRPNRAPPKTTIENQDAPINHDDEVEDRYHVSLAPPQSVHERGFRRACLGSRQRRKMMLRGRSPFPAARQTQPAYYAELESLAAERVESRPRCRRN